MKCNKCKSILGVSLTEMVMLVALIAIVAISSIKLFSQSLGDSYCDSASIISNAGNIKVGGTQNGEMDFIPEEGCKYKDTVIQCPGGVEIC